MRLRKEAAALLLGLTLVTSACANDSAEQGGGGGAEQQATTTSQAGNAAGAGDKAFIDGMTPHHEMGVMMAEDAIKKGQHPELKAFARKMATDQKKEIADMKAHRRSWFGSADTPSMSEVDHGSMQHPQAGPGFDVRWSQEMVKHHQQGIDMAKQALSEAKTPEAKQMARQIIEKQSKEQEQLRRWIASWQGR